MKMSNHYDDYYPSADDIAKAHKAREDEKLKRVMDRFGVSEKGAKKLMEDFSVLYYATVSR